MPRYSRERREGSRPFGAVFGGGGGGGNLEIPESIDYNTQDMVGGVQFANPLTNLTVQATGSWFENDINTMTFENPLFITTNTIAGIPPTTFTRGKFDLYPEQQRLQSAGRDRQKLPRFLKSRVTGVFAIGRNRQNDALIPWAIEPLTGGTINGVSTASMWNTTAALSRPTADRRIGTRLADVGILMNPRRALDDPGQVPLLRHRQQQLGLPGLQSADRTVGTPAQQRIGRIVRDAERRWRATTRPER